MAVKLSNPGTIYVKNIQKTMLNNNSKCMRGCLSVRFLKLFDQELNWRLFAQFLAAVLAAPRVVTFWRLGTSLYALAKRLAAKQGGKIGRQVPLTCPNY